MDLHTVEEVSQLGQQGRWRAGDAYLAGGTYLFAEPRPRLRRLVDLGHTGWQPLRRTPAGLEIAATCTVAELVREITDTPLVAQCCRAFSSSPAVWRTATVGGNLCAALPIAPMISLTATLDAVCLLYVPQDGTERTMPVTRLVTGARRTALREGELLRSVTLPGRSLAGRTAFRRASLYRLGASAALVTGLLDAWDGAVSLTVTASTVRPVRLCFGPRPDGIEVRAALERAVAPGEWCHDVYGEAAWRRHLTFRFAEEIRCELATEAGAAGEDEAEGAGKG
ncbi:FAD binding domain-containing protein [Streptomyces sp. MST-110588]|uniref:FAD binding domain-containing protein n=1 Tax=Streptomyces sp. MST-110588 TaxID=2833628 RepID=UPI001F5E194E|nr:FAD binding domain-containing protein [Streptomyces sp. MST-110588]UNO38444.1 FAD binding domain-containing protein [Streptomyces sp. MST-110588]